MMDEGCYDGRQDITDHLTLTIFFTVKFELEDFAHKKYNVQTIGRIYTRWLLCTIY